ncbi:hypothetical protein GWI33_011735 [Rhynchophorus ferrugineus]|nr:hypothetical protein GWI33_011735 [Rhynchophorus ferrugineus]
MEDFLQTENESQGQTQPSTWSASQEHSGATGHGADTSSSETEPNLSTSYPPVQHYQDVMTTLGFLQFILDYTKHCGFAYAFNYYSATRTLPVLESKPFLYGLNEINLLFNRFQHRSRESSQSEH